jgi:hypothetical protein
MMYATQTVHNYEYTLKEPYSCQQFMTGGFYLHKTSHIHELWFIACYSCKKMGRGSSVGIATGYGLDDQGLGVRVSVGPTILKFSMSSRSALGPTQPLTPAVFNRFCSCFPRCNFSSTLYCQSCWCIIQIMQTL